MTNDAIIYIPDGYTLFDIYEADKLEKGRGIPREFGCIGDTPLNIQISRIEARLEPPQKSFTLSIPACDAKNMGRRLFHGATIYCRVKKRCVVIYGWDGHLGFGGLAELRSEEVLQITTSFDRILIQDMDGF